MADGKTWIYGNNGVFISWDSMFTGATGQNNHNAAVNSGICPAGYSAPTIVDYDNLIIAYGGTSRNGARNGYEAGSTLSGVLLESSTRDRNFWSSTEYDSSSAYDMFVSTNIASSTYSNGKNYGGYYVLCYK